MSADSLTLAWSWRPGGVISELEDLLSFVSPIFTSLVSGFIVATVNLASEKTVRFKGYWFLREHVLVI